MQPLDNITVLIAEDERSVRMLVRVILEAAGATVVEAEDGVRALRMLELHPGVDVLSTDINMPNLDGIGLIHALQTLRPDLPVVACSALDLDTHGASIRGIVHEVVRKPFVPSELVRAIREARDAARPVTRATAS